MTEADRIARLEAEVISLRREVIELVRRLGTAPTEPAPPDRKVPRR